MCECECVCVCGVALSYTVNTIHNAYTVMHIHIDERPHTGHTQVTHRSHTGHTQVVPWRPTARATTSRTSAITTATDTATPSRQERALKHARRLYTSPS